MPLGKSNIESTLLPGYCVSMKTKPEAVNGVSKQDAKYLALIDEYLARIKTLGRAVRVVAAIIGSRCLEIQARQ